MWNAERDARLKQASVEAEAEIKAYRESKEKQYQAEVQKVCLVSSSLLQH